MAGKGLTWTAAHLRSAASADEVRAAVAEVTAQVGDEVVPTATALSLLEELALDATRLRGDVRNATRAREVLLASVAHDLRNPLNTFAMSAGLLRDDLEGPELDRTRALSLLARMDRATTRMQVLIDDLLEASRIEAGSIEMTRRPESIGAVVRAAITKGKPLVTDKSASIEEGSIDDALTATIDRVRSIEGLAKLVAVALKTTGEGGVIRLGAEARDGVAAFTVRALAPRSGTSLPAPDESRGGLAFLIARGLFQAQGAQIVAETTPEGPRTLVLLPA